MSHSFKHQVKLKGKIILFFSFLAIGSVVTPALLGSLVTPVFAQTQSESKAEAERLLNLCRENLGQEQFDAALESCQQALSAYQGIKDLAGEAKSMTNLGIAYLSRGQFDQGISTLEKALGIAKEIGELRIQAIALQLLGIAYLSLEQFQQGTEFLQQALIIAQEIGETKLAERIQQILSSVEEEAVSPQKIEADRLFQQGNQQFNISRYREALKSWQKALEIYRNIDDRNGEVNSLNNLGKVYFYLGQYPQAIDYSQQSLAITQEIGNRQGEANSLNNLGSFYNALGLYPKAIEYYQQSLAIAQEIGDRQGEANSLNNLGVAYWSLGQYPKAIEFFQQSLTIAQEIEDLKGEAAAITNLGLVSFSLGQYPKAIEYNQQSLAIQWYIGDLNGAASSLGNLGSVYGIRGEYPKAIEFFQQSLAIQQEIGDLSGAAKSLVNIGNAHVYLGQYPKALEFYQQSLDITQEIGDRNIEAFALMNLGNAYLYLGHYPKAIEFYQQSLAIQQEIKDLSGAAKSLANLGNAYLYLRQYPKAIDFYEQSLGITQEIGDRNIKALGLMNLGLAYLYQSQYPKAIDFFQQSLAIQQDIGDRNGEASSLGNLGLAYINLGQYSKAIEYYQQSLALFQEIDDSEDQGLALSNIGYLYELQQQPELAIIFYKQSVIVREGIRQDIRRLDRELQESYNKTVAGTYRRLADLLLSQDRIYEAQQVLELLKIQEIQDFTRSPSARGELPKVVFLSQEKKIINSYGKLINFAAEIVKCEETNCSRISALRAQWTAQTRQYDQEVTTLESFIRQRIFNDVEQFLKPNVFDKTANRIIEASDKYNSEQGTVAIYPLILEDKIWLLWATQGEVFSKREITNVGRQQINQEVVNLRNFLQDPNSDVVELQKTAQQLYNWLIKPIEVELKAGEIKHLAFSLDRGFRYIPMAVLHDGEKYLIEKYTVTTFISAEFTDTVDRLPEKPEETPIIGLGASTFSSGYDPLPHVLKEIDSIVQEDHPDDQQGIYPGTQFLNKDFTFRTLQENLRERKLLHIATHADFVPDNQYESFLVLGDGNKLSIPDIKTLRKDLDDIHLVVLSACKTALGDSLLTDPKQEEGIEINALSFYFLSGGAKAVMASLWRVDDASTSQLMQRFYCTLANNPSITKAQALKQAQESLLNNTPLDCEQATSENADFTHPHYWAPFILIGNGL